MSIHHWEENWKKDLTPDLHPELVQLIKKYAPGKYVLEVGYGTGGDLVALSKENFLCFGIEASKIAHEHAQKNFPKSVKTVYGNAEKMPWKDNSFHLIYHQGVLEHFKNPKKFLTEHHRVLKKGGVIIIDVPHKWNVYTLFRIIQSYKGLWYGGWERSYSAKELQQLVQTYKFITVRVHYRGIFPHRWGKFLFPEKIVKRTWAKHIISTPPVSYIQFIARKAYDKSKLIQILSSYNVIMVAQKQ